MSSISRFRGVAGSVSAGTVLALVATAVCTGVGSAQTPLQILVTNDDGIESPGIQVLAAELRTIGEVTVVAPCGERSGSSMSIALAQQLRLRPFELADDVTAYCVDATPAGAVLLGLKALAPDGGFDVVVSGINRGANVGDLAHMSGTVGAAMMGAYRGVPAVAASLGERGDFTYAARFVASFVARLAARSAEPGVVYSINLPKVAESDTRGVAVATMGGSYLELEYDETTGADGERVFDARFRAPDPYPVGSDSEAYANDYITITPLRFDWSAHDLVSDLDGWNLDHRLDDGAGGDPAPVIDQEAVTRREPQFENEHVEVWKSIILPDQPLSMHRHDHPRAIIALRGGTLTVVNEAGDQHDMTWATGKAYWLEADTPGELHGDVNEGTEPVEVIVVQLKNVGGR